MYWRGFAFLSLGRPTTGFGFGAIPLTEMLAYADLIGLDEPDERATFVQYIRDLDLAWLEAISRRGHRA